MGEQHKKPNKLLRYERELRGWSQRVVADSVGTAEQVVSRWESGQHKPNRYFQTELCKLFGKSAEQLGFMQRNASPVVPEIRNHADQIMVQYETGQQDTQQRLNGPHIDPHPLSSPDSSKEAVTVQALESDDGPVNRREATKTLGVFGLQLLGLSTGEQLSKALQTSPALDKRALEPLQSITQNFWQLSESVAPTTLIAPVMGHFEMIAQLLRGFPTPSSYHVLSSLAGEVSQIAARLFFDMKGYKESTQWYTLSIELARRSENPVLETVGIVRKARDVLQSGHGKEAYDILQQAPSLSSQPGAAIAQAYLAAVAAKAHSQLGNADRCRKSLDEASHFLEQIQPGEDVYWTSFDSSLFGDFQGDCYLQLRQFREAGTVFQQALLQSAPSSPRHQSSIMVGLANALMQQGELEQSCHLISNALEVTAQTQSWMILDYILTFRTKVDAWKNESCIQSLDEQIAYVGSKVRRFDELKTL